MRSYTAQEHIIRTSTRALQQLPATAVTLVGDKSRRMQRRLSKRTRKLLIRYGILIANIVVLAVVLTMVIHSPRPSASASNSISSAPSNDLASNALDQVSSADIAVHVARLTNLPEANSVVNLADSVNAQFSVSAASDTVVAKPQVVNTPLKSWKDIKSYVVLNGDTIPSIAAKFNITSDSVRWSNGLTGDSVAAGTKILVPPVSGIAYTVQAGDTPDSLASKYRITKEQIIADNDLDAVAIRVGSVILLRDGNATPVAVTRYVASSYTGFAWGGNTAIYQGGANGYDYGWCTWYAANRRAQLGRPVPSNLGNAYSWYGIAQHAGLPTGVVPAPGAVMVNVGGNHVAVVEVVNGDGSFWISEMNSRGQVSMTDSTPAGGWGRVNWRLVSSVGALKFIY